MESLNDFSIGIFLWQAFLLLGIGMWLFCIIDVLKHKFQSNNKMLWFLVVFFIPFIGSIYYLAEGRNQRIKLES